MSENQNRVLKLVMVGILFFSMFVVAREGAAYVQEIKATGVTNVREYFAERSLNERDGSTENPEEQKKREQKAETNRESEDEKKLCVVIDAGHGGNDPGKVGINDALEKDINLQIAHLLKKFLEMNDIEVVMTREADAGLYDESASNKKVQDMKRRMEIIEKAEPVLVVSIHQNSYHEEYVKGAQVFYYSTGEKSRQLAEIIQEQLRTLDTENKRQAKGNDSYYLLKKTVRPIVIVECGFLSNRSEAEMLITPLYQERVAFQIHMGIMKYLNALY